MDSMDKETIQIRRETRMISRYVGTIWAKWITLLLFLPSHIYLAPSSVYLMALTLLLPLVLQAFSKNQADNGTSSYLSRSKKKYHFSEQKFQAEKNANLLVLLFLCIWQYLLAATNLSAIWRIYPGLLITGNIMTRLIATTVFRITLHHRFTHFQMLED